MIYSLISQYWYVAQPSLEADPTFDVDQQLLTLPLYAKLNLMTNFIVKSVSSYFENTAIPFFVIGVACTIGWPSAGLCLCLMSHFWHALYWTAVTTVFRSYGWIHPKLTYLWTQSLHHVTEKVIQLFVLNVAIICWIKKTSPWVVKVMRQVSVSVSKFKYRVRTSEEVTKWLNLCQIIIIFLDFEFWPAWSHSASCWCVLLFLHRAPLRHGIYSIYVTLYIF